MKKGKWLWWILGGLASLLVIGIIGWNMLYQPGGQKDQSDEPSIEAITLQKQDPVALKGKAALETDDKYFYQEERGPLGELFVTDGQTVEAGQPLFSYRQEEVENQLADLKRQQTRLYNERQELQQQGAVGQGMSQVAPSHPIVAQFMNAPVQEAPEAVPGQGTMGLENGAANPGLNESGQTEVPAPGFDTGQAAEAAQAAEASYQEQLRALNQQIEDVEWNIQQLENRASSLVKARTHGRVMLDLEGQNDNSKPFVRVISEDVSVLGQAGEYDFYLLQEGRRVSLVVPANNEKLKGEVLSFENVPNESSSPALVSDGDMQPGIENAGGSNGNAQYEFTVRPEKKIQPCFSVTITFEMPGFIVPESAFIKERGKTYVFVVEDGQAKKKAVTIEKQGNRYALMKGAKADDILVQDVKGMKDGQEVQVDLNKNEGEGEDRNG